MSHSSLPPSQMAHCIKSMLAPLVCGLIRDQKMTQSEAAERLGVTQPRISALMNGKLDLFSVDALFGYLFALGVQPRLQVQSRDEARLLLSRKAQQS